MKRSKKLRFLSQSVLLEETGLPRANGLIIITIFLGLAGFIAWGTQMPIDEVVSCNGQISEVLPGEGQYKLTALIPVNKMSGIEVGKSATIKVSGVSQIKPFKGMITMVEHAPIKRGDLSYYPIRIVADDGGVNGSTLVLKDMETQVGVIVGTKSFMDYFVGPILSVKSNAFKY